MLYALNYVIRLIILLKSRGNIRDIRENYLLCNFTKKNFSFKKKLNLNFWFSFLNGSYDYSNLSNNSLYCSEILYTISIYCSSNQNIPKGHELLSGLVDLDNLIPGILFLFIFRNFLVPKVLVPEFFFA